MPEFWAEPGFEIPEFEIPEIEIKEDVMSDAMLSIVITVGVLALMCAWVPCLDVVCRRRSRQRDQAPPEWKPVPGSSSLSSLSSRRYAEESRGILVALSERRERGNRDSQAERS